MSLLTFSVLAAALSLGAATVYAARPAAAEEADGAPAAAQPIADGLRIGWQLTKTSILGDAEAMPASGYAYRPKPELRTFAQQMVHAAETLLVFCAAVRGEPNPVPGFVPGQPGPTESVLRDKVEVLAFLNRAIGTCDTLYAGLTDAQLAQPATFFDQPSSAAFLLIFGVAHTQHHEGQATLYLREQGVVPPATARQQAAAASGG